MGSPKTLRKIRFYIKERYEIIFIRYPPIFKVLSYSQYRDDNREHAVKKYLQEFSELDKNWYYKSISQPLLPLAHGGTISVRLKKTKINSSPQISHKHPKQQQFSNLIKLPRMQKR